MSYVVAAYGVVGFALLVYVIVVLMKRARLAREAELLALLQKREAGEGPDEAVSPPATEAASRS